MKNNVILNEWLDGQRGISMNLERADKPDKSRKPRAKSPDEKKQLGTFLKLYNVLAILIGLVLLVSMITLAVTMPDFGSPENPTNNEVVARYVGSAEDETGAENVIAGMILNYRGFDPFGESNVLFLAVCCVMLLMMNPGDGDAAEAEEAEEPDMILSGVCKLLFPCVLLFGVSVLFGGHTSPGGGFSGGSILGAALVLTAVAFGQKTVHRFFTRTVFNVVRITGLMIYAGMFGIYIYQGANGITSDLAHYIVLVIDIAVGLVVMSTIYGFYSFYKKGDL